MHRLYNAVFVIVVVVLVAISACSYICISMINKIFRDFEKNVLTFVPFWIIFIYNVYIMFKNLSDRCSEERQSSALIVICDKKKRTDKVISRGRFALRVTDLSFRCQ